MILAESFCDWPILADINTTSFQVGELGFSRGASLNELGPADFRGSRVLFSGETPCLPLKLCGAPNDIVTRLPQC